VRRGESDAPIVGVMYDLLFGGRDPVDEPGTATGTPGDWWTVVANSPDILEHAVSGFALYQSENRVLAPVLRELAQARVGFTVGSRFVFSQHCKSLRDLGVSDERIAAIPRWSTADCFDALERLVLAYADSLVLEHGRVPDQLMEELRSHLSDVEVLELTYIATMFLQHAVLSRALRTEYDDVDEDVTEVIVDGADDTLARMASGPEGPRT
jgi:alkylhydroperoxidase family enzyme